MPIFGLKIWSCVYQLVILWISRCFKHWIYFMSFSIFLYLFCPLPPPFHAAQCVYIIFNPTPHRQVLARAAIGFRTRGSRPTGSCGSVLARLNIFRSLLARVNRLWLLLNRVSWLWSALDRVNCGQNLFTLANSDESRFTLANSD